MKNKNQKSAQDIQDEIFRKMSAEESVRLAGQFYRFASALNKLGENYDGARRIVKKNFKNSH